MSIPYYSVHGVYGGSPALYQNWTRRGYQTNHCMFSEIFYNTISDPDQFSGGMSPEFNSSLEVILDSPFATRYPNSNPCQPAPVMLRLILERLPGNQIVQGAMSPDCQLNILNGSDHLSFSLLGQDL